MFETLGKKQPKKRKKTENEKGGRILQPLFTKSVVDRIIEQITQAIVERRLPPGKKIPTELELCESLGVGRNSVREAIKVLVTMGVLEIRRSEGTYVTAGFSERMLDPILYGLILEGTDTLDLAELRVVFETGVFRYATEKRGDEDIDKLKAALEEMAVGVSVGRPDPEEVLASDLHFHRVVAAAINNPLVEKMNLVLERLTLPRRMEAIRRSIEQNEYQRLVNRHSAMLRVISAQDVGAVDGVILEHFRNWRTSRTVLSGEKKTR